MRTIVDIDNGKAVNIRNLGLIEKILTPIRMRHRDSKMYKRNQEKEQAKLDIARMTKIDKLKEVLLYRINQNLLDNKSKIARENGKLIKSMTISVDRGYKDVIRTVIESKEFLAYNIKLKRENPDILLACPSLPLLLEIEKKVITNED